MKIYPFGQLITAFSVAALLSACGPDDKDTKQDPDTSNEKLTGIWLFTGEGTSSLMGEGVSETTGIRNGTIIDFSTEFKTQLLVLVTESDDKKISFESYDTNEMLDFDDQIITSNKISHSDGSGTGLLESQLHDVNITFDRDEKTATATDEFKSDKSPWSQTLTGKRISTSVAFENQGAASINLSVLMEESISVINEAMNIPIICYSAMEETGTIIVTKEENVETTIVFQTYALDVEGRDTNDNQLLVNTNKSKGTVTTHATDGSSATQEELEVLEIEVYYQGADSEDVTYLYFDEDEVSGDIDLDNSHAAVNIGAENDYGDAAMVEFALEYTK